MGLSLSTLKCPLIKGLLLILAILFFGINAADCEERVYYSIHLASFECLQNANVKVNALKKKANITECIWANTRIDLRPLNFGKN
jgi:hypothetical protein